MGWRAPCDGDASNDGVYSTLFFDGSGTGEVFRSSIVPKVVDIPAIDIYFLVDGTASMDGEVTDLRNEIANVIADVETLFQDPHLGVGLARQYPALTASDELSELGSQAPFHHVLDVTDDTVLLPRRSTP